MIIKTTPVSEMKKYMQVFKSHGEEVPFISGRNEVELDVELYEQVESTGCLSILCAYTDEGELAGYMILIAEPLTHHKDKWAAVTDAFYVLPKFRGQGVFKLLSDYAESYCKQCGITSLFICVNSNFPDAAKAVESLVGYEQSCVMYAKEF